MDSESITCKPALQPATDVGMHGLLAVVNRVTILCYPLVCVHCWPVADFFIAKQTSLHPFDFVRNLFHYFVYTAVQAKLAVDENTQVDLLTADGEYLYTAAAALTVYMYCSTVIVILHEYKTKLTASAEEEQQELLKVLEQTKRMGYARDLQISTLESDGQLMLEKCEY